MVMFTKIVFILVAIFVIFWLFSYLKANPKALSKENLSKSFFTLGVLALLLIGFIFILVLIVKM
jgi:hypothetical protein